MRLGLFSVCSNNYLSLARVLMDSARAHLPAWRRHLCLADRAAGGLDPATEAFEQVESHALGIPRHDDFAFRYDIMEYNTAIKPFMFRWLFDHTDLDALVYLDPDIEIFSAFETLEGMLQEGASVVFTPHVTEPLPDDGRKPTDLDIQLAGVFNLGFLAVRRCPEARAFLDWWAAKLRRQCVSDHARGLFVDQKWCNFAPGFLPQCRVLRDPGYNVAYWNLHYRRLAREGATWRVNGRPLVFFHYSGINLSDLSTLSKHETRFGSPARVPNLPPLLERYARRIEAAGHRQTRALPYAYGAFDDGAPIHPLMRALYRETVDAAPESVPGAPFARSTLEALCRRPARALPACPEAPVTELMHSIWRQRPDVQMLFSLATRAGREGFARWFAASAKPEYGLPEWVVPDAPRARPSRRARAAACLLALARKVRWLAPGFLRRWGKRLYWKSFEPLGKGQGH